LGSAGIFTACRGFPSSRMNLAVPSVVDVGLTTLLSIAVSRCRPAASSVCTLPLVLQVDKYPLAATSLRQVPTERATFDKSKMAGHLSADDFPQVRFPVSVARLSPRGSQGLVGLVVLMAAPRASC